MNYRFLLPIMIAICASATAHAREINCYSVDQPNGGGSINLRINEVTDGNLLPSGTYIYIYASNSQSNIHWLKPSLYLVRAGAETLQTLRERVEANSDHSSAVSFKDIRFSAVVVEIETTKDLRGKYAAIVDGSNIHLGDSFHAEDPYYLGKNAGFELSNCY